MAAKKPPTADSRCGTYAGHQAHCKRGEKPCEPCRLARNTYVASVRDVGQGMARTNALHRVLAEFARRHPEEYRELYDAEYPRALAEQRAKSGGGS
jgi:hypothetical protein